MIYLLPQPSFFKELQFCTFALIKYKNADFYGLQSISPGHGIEQKGDLLKRDWRFAVDSGRVIVMDLTACSRRLSPAAAVIAFFPINLRPLMWSRVYRMGRYLSISNWLMWILKRSHSTFLFSINFWKM